MPKIVEKKPTNVFYKEIKAFAAAALRTAKCRFLERIPTFRDTIVNKRFIKIN